MNNLKQIREAAHMTQAELAEAAGTSQAYIAQIEGDVSREPRVRLAYQIARALGSPLEEVFDVGPMETDNDGD